MATEVNQVLSDLKKGQYSPIYILHGEEDFFIDQVSDFIEENALDASQKGFNQVICYGSDVEVATIMQHAKRFPMMSDKQVVIVKEAQSIKDLGKEDAEKLLVQYLLNPVPSTILVFAHKNKKIDGRKALGKALTKAQKAKTVVAIATEKLKDYQVPAWIQDYVKTRSCKITPKAAAMLHESVGNDLSKVVNGLNKVLVNFQGSIEITEDHIEKYVGISKEYNVFELQNAVQNKEIFKANQIVMRLGIDPKAGSVMMIIPSLYGFFMRLLQVHCAADKSEASVASLLKVHPFVAKQALVGARNYPLQKIPIIVAALREADQQAKGMKGNAIKNEEILKELVYKVLYS